MKKQNNNKKHWLLVGLGAVWSVIAYVFCSLLLSLATKIKVI